MNFNRFFRLLPIVFLLSASMSQAQLLGPVRVPLVSHGQEVR